MKYKFSQSEAGNITVVDTGKNLLIYINLPEENYTFIISNPAHPNPFQDVHEVDVKIETDSPADILKKINDVLADIVK